MGNSTPPLPYPVSQDLAIAVGTVPNVRFNDDPVYVLDQSTQPSCKGDERGSCKGVKRGTVNGEVTPKEEGWWSKASPWVHGALGLASFVPIVSTASGGLDAVI